jgi:hypothetical protein
MPGLSGPGPAYSALCVRKAAEPVDVRISEASLYRPANTLRGEIDYQNSRGVRGPFNVSHVSAGKPIDNRLQKT